MCKSTTKIFSKRIRFIIVLAVLLLCSKETIFSQQVEMSQYWAAPLNLNPAMAGISYGPRASINYRNQWPEMGDGFNGGFTTYMASFDAYIPKIKSGIGIMYTGDYIFNNTLSSNKLTLSYAYQIKLTKKLGMRIGIEGSFIQQRINWSQLHFSDMINPYTGFYSGIDQLNPTAESPPATLQRITGDAGLGILLFNNKFYGGFSMRNMVHPKNSFFRPTTSVTDFRFIGHLGTNFNIKHKKNYRYNIFVSPNVLLANQGKFFQANVGVMGGVSLFYAGFWFRYAFNNPDAVIGVVGVKKGKWRFGYSYDVTISKLMGKTGGSHELTLIFNWSGSDDNSFNPAARNAYIPCPEILNF